MTIASFREIATYRRDEFIAKGYKERHFFPHRIYQLPKCGPDGYKLAGWMSGVEDLNSLWELVLYATGGVVEELPSHLYFDDDLIWHRQHFGRPAQVATVNLAISGSTLHTMVHISDLVQRISRRRRYKTRIENRFKGWNHMLLNGIFNFARERGIEEVRTPTAALALKNTDPARDVQEELFDRIYDRNVTGLFPARRQGDWWVTRVDQATDRIVIAEKGEEVLPTGPFIAICHDVEREMGHDRRDPAYAEARDHSETNLKQMLAIESSVGLRSTYNVVGSLMEEVKSEIDAGGHCIAFHSYDHQIGRDRRRFGRSRRTPREVESQLGRCREVDYRIKGYRAPQSRITDELSDENLCRHNFEWFASSGYSLGIAEPEMRNRVVKIPIEMDDYELFRGAIDYENWEEQVLMAASGNRFTAIGLHDCYGAAWLPRYERLIERIAALGTFQTLDEVAAQTTFVNAV